MINDTSFCQEREQYTEATQQRSAIKALMSGNTLNVARMLIHRVSSCSTEIKRIYPSISKAEVFTPSNTIRYGL